MNLLFRLLFGAPEEDIEKDYDMWDYQHPDDFYESHMDDFDSFEDAEEYYYNHGGR